MRKVIAVAAFLLFAIPTFGQTTYQESYNDPNGGPACPNGPTWVQCTVTFSDGTKLISDTGNFPKGEPYIEYKSAVYPYPDIFLLPAAPGNPVCSQSNGVTTCTFSYSDYVQNGVTYNGTYVIQTKFFPRHNWPLVISTSFNITAQ